MADEFLTVEITGDRSILRNLDQMPETVRAILRDKLFSMINKLEDRVSTNISSRLGTKSGRLLAGVGSEMREVDGRIEATVYVRAPHARAQDRGAVIPPHIIRPRNGKLLAFVAATGDKVMATKVNHPGGIIPATNFMKDAYSSMGPEISRGIKNAVVQGIRQQMRSSS